MGMKPIPTLEANPMRDTHASSEYQPPRDALQATGAAPVTPDLCCGPFTPSPSRRRQTRRTRHRLQTLGRWSFVWAVALATTCVPCLPLNFYLSPAPGNMSVYSD